MAVANIILDWNDVANDAVRRDYSTSNPSLDPSPAQVGPTATSRALAMVHIAIYDAYHNHSGGKTYLNGYSAQLDPQAADFAESRQVAVSIAAHDTLRRLYPAQSGALAAALASSLRAIGAAPSAELLGTRVGQEVASRVLRERQGDGSGAAEVYASTFEPFDHDDDPENLPQRHLHPGWGRVRPFGVKDLVARIPGRPWRSRGSYTRDYQEVQGKGARTGSTRTPHETDTGLYWAYDGARNIGVPPLLYNQVVRAIVQAAGAVSEAMCARLFAVVNVAMADAGIQCWEQKYRERLWRPVLGIQRDPTAPERGWQPLGAPRSNQPRPGFTPPFPAYPSGHATFGTAALEATRAVLGLPASFTFSFISDELDGATTDERGNPRQRVSRTMTIDQAIQENLESRVFLGVHWRMDGLEGRDNGAEIAALVAANFPALA